MDLLPDGVTEALSARKVLALRKRALVVYIKVSYKRHSGLNAPHVGLWAIRARDAPRAQRPLLLTWRSLPRPHSAT